MKKSRLLGIVCVVLIAFIAGSASAALLGRLPATSGGTDYQAYYDNILGITWAANANINENGGPIKTGADSWDNQTAWVAGLTIGGVSGWRLPSVDVNGDGNVYGWHKDSSIEPTDNEFFYHGNWNSIRYNGPDPFKNVSAGPYWSSYALGEQVAMSFGFWNGGLGGPLKGNALFAWPVHDGDVAAPNITAPIAIFLAPGWHTTDFLSLGIPTRAIAFDSSDNLYIEFTGDDSAALHMIEVLKLSASSGYKDVTSYAKYNYSSVKGVTGLDFDGLGSLYVGEHSGVTREIDAATQTLTNYLGYLGGSAGSGLDADTLGNIFFSQRLDHDDTWGRIVRTDADGIEPPVILSDNTVATGIAVDASGYIFISTPERTNLPLLGNSIYRFDAGDTLKNPELIATFNVGCGELTFDTAGNLYMVAGYNMEIDNQVNIIQLSGNTGQVNLNGSIKTTEGVDICAMVLASGQFMFSCKPAGVFSLPGLPSEQDDTVKRQIYADGFFPKIDVLTDSTEEAVVMTRSGACPNYNTPIDPNVYPDSSGKWMDISGSVKVGNNGDPICAMVLANGQHMFSCDGSGSYALNIPLDTNGQFKLQVYADGFAPTIQTFDEFNAANDVHMARAAECQ